MTSETYQEHQKKIDEKEKKKGRQTTLGDEQKDG